MTSNKIDKYEKAKEQIIKLHLATVRGNYLSSKSLASGLLFKWNHSRHIWRIRLIYLAYGVILLIFICIPSWLYTFYVKRINCTSYTHCGWFTGHVCSRRRLNWIKLYFVIFSIYNVVIICLCFLEAFIIKSFIHTSIRDLMLATRSALSGRLAKRLPWVIAILEQIGLTLSLVGNIVFYSIGACSQKLKPIGRLAVTNCRLYFSRCCGTDNFCPHLGVYTKSIVECNTLTFLQDNYFLKNIVEYKPIMLLCGANNIRTLIDDCSSFPSLEDCLVEPNKTSNLQIFYNFIIILITCSFLLQILLLQAIKLTSCFDPFFFSAGSPNESYIVSITRKVFTPWSSY